MIHEIRTEKVTKSEMVLVPRLVTRDVPKDVWIAKNGNEFDNPKSALIQDVGLRIHQSKLALPNETTELGLATCLVNNRELFLQILNDLTAEMAGTVRDPTVVTKPKCPVLAASPEKSCDFHVNSRDWETLRLLMNASRGMTAKEVHTLEETRRSWGSTTGTLTRLFQKGALSRENHVYTWNPNAKPGMPLRRAYQPRKIRDTCLTVANTCPKVKNPRQDPQHLEEYPNNPDRNKILDQIRGTKLLMGIKTIEIAKAVGLTPEQVEVHLTEIVADGFAIRLKGMEETYTMPYPHLIEKNAPVFSSHPFPKSSSVWNDNPLYKRTLDIVQDYGPVSTTEVAKELFGDSTAIVRTRQYLASWTLRGKLKWKAVTGKDSKQLLVVSVRD